MIHVYDFPHGARGLRVAWLCEEGWDWPTPSCPSLSPRTATAANSPLRHRSDHQNLFLPNLKIGITDRPLRAHKQPRDQQKAITHERAT